MGSGGGEGTGSRTTLMHEGRHHGAAAGEEAARHPLALGSGCLIQDSAAQKKERIYVRQREEEAMEAALKSSMQRQAGTMAGPRGAFYMSSKEGVFHISYSKHIRSRDC